MAYDENLAARVLEAVSQLCPVQIVEKKMFGGIAYMVQGNMCVGIIQDSLMVRVGKKNYEEMLNQPHAQIMDFTGRPMRGFVTVAPEGIESAQDLTNWLQRGLDYALSLPAK